MNTDNPQVVGPDRRAILASITSTGARLAVVSDNIVAEMQRRYWRGYWTGSRAFLGSVRRIREREG